MSSGLAFDKIKHSHIRAFHTVMTERSVSRAALRLRSSLPVRIVRCPVQFPARICYQLWHDLTHAWAAARWLRDPVRDVARGLLELRP